MPIPAQLDSHGVGVLLLTLLALILFRQEKFPLESTCLFILLCLIIGFEIFPYEIEGKPLDPLLFFSGFSHEALIAVCTLMIAGQGLVRTGALEPIGRYLARFWRISPMLSLLATLVIGAVLSAFINNTPIVVLLLPILISVSLRTKAPASQMLMPMGFATIVGGMTTTIGTSTNLLVVSVASDLGVPKFSMFHFALPASMAAGIGIIYLWLIAPKLITIREGRLRDTSPRIFSSRLKVIEGSYAIGKTLSEVMKKTGDLMKVERVKRGVNNVSILPLPDVELRMGDKLYVSDTPENLKEFEQVLGTALYTGNTLVDAEHPLTADEQQLAEVVVVPGSPLAGSTLKNTRFIVQYNLVTIALHRAGKKIKGMRKGVGKEVLRVGDVLLVQGAREQISALRETSGLLVLDATADLPRSKRAVKALIILALIVVTAATGLLPIAVSASCGVLAMILTKCLDWRDASRAMNTQVIMIVVVSLALGMALLNTGGALFLAEAFVNFTSTLGASPAIVLSLLMLLLAFLTNIVSNNAAAVIGTPIAISVAQQLGMDAEPFVIAVLFGANMSYATPMAYKTNLLVMNAGAYTFSDFLKIGIPLTLLLWLSLSFILPWLYNF